MLFERIVLPHFFLWYALVGGVAEWVLVCWFGARLGWWPPVALHVLGPAVLAVVILKGARIFRRDEPEPVSLGTRAWRFVTATALASMGGAITLGVTALGWLLVQVVATRAEAGSTLATGADRLLDGSFATPASAAIVVVLATIGYGYRCGYRRLRIRRLTLPISGLPPALAGLRLVHVSDLHLGPLADRVALRTALAAVSALDPDLVCVTGDTVDNRYTDLPSWLPELARLRARHGVFAILGNHDRYVGADAVAGALASVPGWRVLRDEVTVIDVGGAQFHLVGLDDRPQTEAADALPALLATLPAGAPAIVLVHHPAAFPAIAASGVALTLAGHTHAGQLAVPGLPRLNPARLFVTRFDAGLFVEDGAALYVSAGLGTSGQRVRVGVPREIVVLTLVPALSAAA